MKTIEEKARAYDEALERAKIWQEHLNEVGDKDFADELNYIFSRFRESEDERIRKAIHIYLDWLDGRKDYAPRGEYSIRDMIAWLEKQGQEPRKVSIWKHWKDGIAGNGEGEPIYLTKVGNTYSLTSCLGFECDYIELSELDNLMLEKKGEQKPNPYSGTSFEYNGHTWGMCARDNGVDILLDKQLFKHLEKQGEKKYIDDLTQQEAMDIAVAKCFEQGGQKPVDKVEQKFKVGDWITNDYCAGKVIELTNDAYLLDTGQGIPFSCEHNVHLWTIQDAKDGDVLVNGSNIFIFHFLNDTRLMGYCHVNTDDGRFYDDIGKNECFCLIDAIVNPATKEQRDLLFQKMKEAGYEWDAEKKELKKIHVIDEGKAEMDYCFTKMMNGEKISSSEEEYNGEDYGIDGLWHAMNILERTLGKVSGYQTDDGFLSHQCAITAVKKLYEQKPTWSKEDEQIILSIEQVMNCASLLNIVPEKIDKIRTWIKSLKERIGG